MAGPFASVAVEARAESARANGLAELNGSIEPKTELLNQIKERGLEKTNDFGGIAAECCWRLDAHVEFVSLGSTDRSHSVL